MEKTIKNKRENKDRLTFRELRENNLFAMKLGFATSKPIVLHSLFTSMFGYFEWIFYSAFFMRFIIDALDQEKGFREIISFILASCVLFIAFALYHNYVLNVVQPIETLKLFYGVNKKLFHKAKNVELRCYEDSDFYNKYTMAMNNAGNNIIGIIDNTWGVVVGAVSTLVIFYSMFDIDKYAVLFVIFPIIGNFVFGKRMNKLQFERYEENVPNNKVMNYVNRAMYMPEYAKEIRLSRVFTLLKKQFNDATENEISIARKFAFRLANMNFWRITFTFTVMFEGVMLYAIYGNLVRKTISLAELGVLSSLMVSATWILIGLFENIMGTMKLSLFVKNLKEFLEYKESIPEDQDGILPSETIESIEFDHVYFSYQQENTIRDLSFTINRNEMVAFVGHNGAGKTTIIKLLFRLYDPTEGVIRVNGVDVREYNLKAYRNLFAAAFQDYKLFGMSVMDNVLMGKVFEGQEEKVVEALRKAGVYERIMKLPQGIHTIMTKEFDEDGAVLSGGESQKVVVARAFVKPSPIKVFDEPSSALDPIAEFDLYNSIMKDGEDRTMIFISHRLSSVKNADKVFMLEHGQIIESGTHKELMKQDGNYAQMYKKQAMNYLAMDSVEGVEL